MHQNIGWVQEGKNRKRVSTMALVPAGEMTQGLCEMILEKLDQTHMELTQAIEAWPQ